MLLILPALSDYDLRSFLACYFHQKKKLKET